MIQLLKAQVSSFFLVLFSYMLIMLLGVLVGGILVYIPGITETFASFTTLHPSAILAIVMVFAKVLKS